MRRFAGCLALLLLAGCHEPFSNEDILFLKSLPRDVQFDVPDDGDTGRGLVPTQTPPEQVAQFYRDMVRSSTESNEVIFEVLQYVETITSSAAVVRDDDRRAWGPIRPESKNEAELLLVVDRVRTATVVAYTSQSEAVSVGTLYRYAFSVRATSSSEWVQLLFGESVVLSADDSDATGYFCFDLDQKRMLRPMDPESGSYCVSYDFQGAQETVEMSVQIPGSIYVNPDAAFSLHRRDDGSGRFFFSQRGNVFPEEDPSVPEISSVTVRWDPTLAARADVSVCGGDTTYEIWATECWNQDFIATFFLNNFGAPSFGRLSSCPSQFQEEDAISQPCRED